MVKASTYGGRGGKPFPPGEVVDTGMPVTHPAVMIPIIGMIILFIIGFIICFCKFWPHLVPESCRIFGRRSANKDLELQLGRRERSRSRSPRRPSDVSQVSGGPGNRTHHPQGSRPESFNSKDWAGGRPYLDEPPRYPAPPLYGSGTPLPYGLSPLSMSTALPPPPPSYESFKNQKNQESTCQPGVYRI